VIKKATGFGCVKQFSSGFVFQKRKRRKSHSYRHTFDNKTYRQDLVLT